MRFYAENASIIPLWALSCVPTSSSELSWWTTFSTNKSTSRFAIINYSHFQLHTSSANIFWRPIEKWKINQEKFISNYVISIIDFVNHGRLQSRLEIQWSSWIKQEEIENVYDRNLLIKQTLWLNDENKLLSNKLNFTIN